MTRKDKVLHALREARRNHHVTVPTVGKIADAPGGWVDGWVLCHPGIGGTEGLRRLRELRADGVIIEKQHSPFGDGYMYHLVFEGSR